MIPLLLSLAASAPASAGEAEVRVDGAEIALVLDMDAAAERDGRARALRVGAYLLDGARGGQDHLTILGLADEPKAPPAMAMAPWEIGRLTGRDGGALEPALHAAAAALWTSPRTGKLLALAATSAPTVPPDLARELVDQEGDPWLPVHAVAVGPGASAWLTGFIEQGDDLADAGIVGDDQGAGIALDVAEALAIPLSARPQRARLGPGEHALLGPGAPVRELALMLAQPGGQPAATLWGPDGEVPHAVAGALPCGEEAPPGCEPLGFMSFRVSVSPGTEPRWSLRIPEGEEVYALVLARPALRAALAVPDELVAGVEAPIALSLIDANGQPVADPSALLGPGVYARAFDDHVVIPLEQGAVGRFLGRWTPIGPAGRLHLRARLQSARVDLRASAETWVEGELSPILLPDPAVIDLGSWTGEWIESRRCAEIDLSRSFRAAGLKLLCRAGGRLADARLTCEPTVDQAGLEVPRRWTACVVAEGCCAELPTADDRPASLHFLAAETPEAPPLLVVPVRYSVSAASFWRCNFAALLATSALGLMMLVGLGARTRRRRFAAGVGLRFSSSEPGLRRVNALYMDRAARREGLLGPDRVWVDPAGQLCDPGDGLLALEAGLGGAAMVSVGPRLERRLSSGAWETVSEGERLQGLQPGAVYRVDERLYFTLAPA